MINLWVVKVVAIATMTSIIYLFIVFFFFIQVFQRMRSSYHLSSWLFYDSHTLRIENHLKGEQTRTVSRPWGLLKSLPSSKIRRNLMWKSGFMPCVVLIRLEMLLKANWSTERVRFQIPISIQILYAVYVQRWLNVLLPTCCVILKDLSSLNPACCVFLARLALRPWIVFLNLTYLFLVFWVFVFLFGCLSLFTVVIFDLRFPTWIKDFAFWTVCPLCVLLCHIFSLVPHSPAFAVSVHVLYTYCIN